MTKFIKPKIQIREFLVYCIGLKRKRSKRRRISWGRRRRRTRFSGWQQGFLKIWLSPWICTAMIEERGNIVNTWPRFLHFISFLNKFDIFTFEIQDIFWISDNFWKYIQILQSPHANHLKWACPKIAASLIFATYFQLYMLHTICRVALESGPPKLCNEMKFSSLTYNSHTLCVFVKYLIYIENRYIHICEKRYPYL